MGLSICARLVAMMGGQINVQSVADQGSTFTVTVPFDMAAECAISAEPFHDLHGVNVLVIASDPLIGNDLSVYLNQAGAAAEWGFSCWSGGDQGSTIARFTGDRGGRDRSL
ncbi:MAG: hypothetical protein HC889_11520 [Synechococcaceae cyanobacterium SM1_2_3]|nr:hypothetical protein [Synechococcaceae cyanobacterium SM1_2_3]